MTVYKTIEVDCIYILQLHINLVHFSSSCFFPLSFSSKKLSRFQQINLKSLSCLLTTRFLIWLSLYISFSPWEFSNSKRYWEQHFHIKFIIKSLKALEGGMVSGTVFSNFCVSSSAECLAKQIVDQYRMNASLMLYFSIFPVECWKWWFDPSFLIENGIFPL